MGNSATCFGPDTDFMVYFPSQSSVVEAQQLQAELSGLESSLTTFTAVPDSFIPVLGPLIACVLTFLSNTDFGGTAIAYTRAQIHEGILENDIVKYNAEISSIQSSYIRLQNANLTAQQIQPELVYALRRYTLFIFILIYN